MKFILLLSIYHGPNPIYALLGFILMIIIIVLSIREKIRKPKQSNAENSTKEFENLYIEKDVLGLDKTYINYKEQTYKSADKSKLKFIAFIVIFIIGLFLLIVFTPIRYSPYKGSASPANIHHPEENNKDHLFGPFYWDYQDSRKPHYLDSTLIYEPNDIFENEE